MVPTKLRDIPILAKLIQGINWFIDLVYVENGTLFNRFETFVLLVIGLGSVIIVLIMIFCLLISLF